VAGRTRPDDQSAAAVDRVRGGRSDDRLTVHGQGGVQVAGQGDRIGHGPNGTFGPIDILRRE
jgi:hypothetical protein